MGRLLLLNNYAQIRPNERILCVQWINCTAERLECVRTPKNRQRTNNNTNSGERTAVQCPNGYERTSKAVNVCRRTICIPSTRYSNCRTTTNERNNSRTICKYIAVFAGLFALLCLTGYDCPECNYTSQTIALVVSVCVTLVCTYIGWENHF